MSEILPPGVALPQAGTITMFSTTWCGYCRRLKGDLDRAGIGYTEVNIEDSSASAELGCILASILARDCACLAVEARALLRAT